MLAERPGDEVGGTEVLDLLEDEALPPDDPSVADVEDLHRGVELGLGDPHDVEVLVGGANDVLVLAGEAGRLELVAQARRPLVLLGRGGPAHAPLETRDDRLGVALEEARELLDEHLVVGRGHRADARARAAFDVVEETRPPEPLVAGELRVRAGPDRERPHEHVEHLPGGVGLGVRAEIARALAPRAPHERDARPGLVRRHGDVGVALVVDEPDVEVRPVRLDQAVLEHDRLDLGAHLDPLDRARPLEHLLRAGVELGRVAEVAGEPLAQREGLADVDHTPVGVLELVRAGRVRDG